MQIVILLPTKTVPAEEEVVVGSRVVVTAVLVVEPGGLRRGGFKGASRGLLKGLEAPYSKQVSMWLELEESLRVIEGWRSV